MSPQLLMLILIGTHQCLTTGAHDGMRLEHVLQPNPQFQFNSHFSQNAFQNSNPIWGSKFNQDTNQPSNLSPSNVNKDQPKIKYEPFSNFNFPVLPPLQPRQNSQLLPPSRPINVFQRQPDVFPSLPPRQAGFPTLPPMQPRQPHEPSSLTLPPVRPRTLATFSSLVYNVLPDKQSIPMPSQCPAHCYEGWTNSKMERPPQLDHMFGTCEKKNETNEEEELSYSSIWGAISGSKPETEVLVGVEPQCSDGRCWCPLLHVCDTETGRCISKNSVFENCNDSQFKCTNGKCIEGHLRCDGLSNCLDGSDEIECYLHSCLSHQHKCDDGKCVNYHDNLICNSILDCFDGSDEAVCDGSIECSSNQFQCIASGKCIYEDWRCDGFPDCHDASDELDCISNCSAAQWRCDDGSCIAGWRKCDFNHDCPDGSDEKTCVMCTIDQFSCVNSSVKCVPMDTVCNYEWDCDDGSDEFNCKNAGRGGNLDWIVDKLISVFNTRIPRWIPSNSEIARFGNEISDPLFKKLKKKAPSAIQSILCGLDINEVKITGVENVFRRKEEAWVHIENKEITFKAKIATNRIVVKVTASLCTPWYIPTVRGVVGFETDGFELSVKVKMITEDCAKPKLHDISLTGNLRPILNLNHVGLLIEGGVGVAGYDLDKLFRDFVNEQVDGLRSELPNKITNGFNEMVKKIGDSTCVGESISVLADTVEVALEESVMKMIASIKSLKK